MVWNISNAIRLVLLLFCSLIVNQTEAQKARVKKPKLIVGIVVDQMRQDYLTRFWPLYGQNGFRKLVTQGYSFDNNHYNYVPTYTGPGHACISTGATPMVNGIVGNNWYQRSLNKVIYCCEDTTVMTVGAPTHPNWRLSPRNLLSTTIGDELKLATNDRAKVFGVALKDRGAILSSGHKANAAYWWDAMTGNFVTSTYYMNELPTWVQQYNAKENSEVYLKKTWSPLLPIAAYLPYCSPDSNGYEGMFKGEASPIFPHDIPGIRVRAGADVLRTTPYGNSITVDFAKELLVREQLGKDSITDMLWVSFSSTDYIGHQYGPRSIEVADCYLRLDRDLADFFQFIQSKVGTDVVYVLSADHAVAEVPAYCRDQKLPGGVFGSAAEKAIRKASVDLFGKDVVLAFENLQVYYNETVLKELNFSAEEVSKQLIPIVLKIEGVAQVFSAEQVRQYQFTHPLLQKLQNGFHPQRCGDLVLLLHPGWVETGYITGTSHGSGYTYDTHVPCVWYGPGYIPKGRSVRNTAVADIAPTLSALLQIQMPSGAMGEVLYEIIR